MSRILLLALDSLSSHHSTSAYPVRTELPQPQVIPFFDASSSTEPNTQPPNHSILQTAPTNTCLPTELLAEIFAYCGGVTVSSNEISVPGVSIGAVCYHWRAVALAVPDLWSNISVSLHDLPAPASCEDDSDHAETAWDPTNGAGRVRSALRSALERSQGAPITLSLALPSAAELNVDLLRLLMSKSHHWRSLKLSLSDPHNLAALAPIEGNLPILEDLDIDVKYWSDVPFVSRNIFSSAPMLRAVRLWGTGFADITDTALIFPFEDITHLTCDALTCSDAIQTAALFPKLQSMRLTSSFTSSVDEVIQADDVYHLSVPSLAFLSGTTLPGLRSLTLCPEGATGLSVQSFHLKGFRDFLVRSGCVITSFNFTRLPIDGKTLLALLELLPNLTSLTIDEAKTRTNGEPAPPCLTDDLLHGITNLPALLPSLQHLTFASPASYTSFSDDLFVEMVSERRHLLTTVSLQLPSRAFSLAAFQKLRTLELRDHITIQVVDSSGVVFPYYSSRELGLSAESDISDEESDDGDEAVTPVDSSPLTRSLPMPEDNLLLTKPLELLLPSLTL